MKYVTPNYLPLIRVYSIHACLIIFCMLAGALAVSEVSIMSHSDTLILAYQQTLTVLRNYQFSKLPYDYAVDLSK